MQLGILAVLYLKSLSLFSNIMDSCYKTCASVDGAKSGSVKHKTVCIVMSENVLAKANASVTAPFVLSTSIHFSAADKCEHLEERLTHID